MKTGFTNRNPIVLLEKPSMKSLEKCTKFKSKESTMSTTKQNPIVLLKKLDKEILGKYLNMNLRKANLKLEDAMQGLSLDVTEQFFDSGNKSKLSDVKKNKEMDKRRENSISSSTWAAEFQHPTVLPNPCKIKKCEHICEYISDEWRYQLNKNFWCLDSEDAKKAFFEDIIRYNWKAEDCVTCHYFINIKGSDQKVCLKFLLATLNIKIDLIAQHVSKALKEGKN